MTGPLVLHLLHLLLHNRRRVSLLRDILPLLRSLVRLLDRRHESRQRRRNSRLERLRREHIIRVVFLEFSDVRVDEGFGVAALNDEFLLAFEAGDGEEDEFDGGDDAVVFDDFGRRFGFADLLGDYVRRVEEVDFAVWFC